VAEQTSSPTPTATARPSSRPTPEPEGELAKVQEVVLAYQSSSDYVRYQVIVELRNTGTGWAQVQAFQSDYTVLNAAGGVTATGQFLYAYPEYIGPGATGYLFEEGIESGLTPADFSTVHVDGRFESVMQPGATFEITQIAWRQAEFSNGLTATGFLTVTSSTEVQRAALAVFCLGEGGQILGGSSTNLLQNLSPGTPKGFETVVETPPISPSQCVTTIGFAEDTGF
jgi:hypothetical protein